MASSNKLTRIPKDVIIENPPRYVNVSRPGRDRNQGVEWHHIQRIVRRHWKPSLAFLLGLEAIRPAGCVFATYFLSIDGYAGNLSCSQ